MNHDEQTLAATLRSNPDLLRVNVNSAGAKAYRDLVGGPEPPCVEDCPYKGTCDNDPQKPDYCPKQTEPHEVRWKRPRSNRHAEAITLIVDAAHALGWRVAFFRPARTEKGWRTPVGGDGMGWPDLTLARQSVWKGEADIIFWEVKVGHDRVRPEQAVWLDLLGGRVVNPFNEADWQFIQGALR